MCVRARAYACVIGRKHNQFLSFVYMFCKCGVCVCVCVLVCVFVCALIRCMRQEKEARVKERTHDDMEARV